MDALTLQDRIARGMGVAAGKAGCPFTIYRPQGADDPVGPRNRLMELCAFFEGGRYDQPVWRGVYDCSYTRQGDYLAGAERTYFVGSQVPALPVQCVLTNRVVMIVRPQPAVQGGYSGFFSTPGQSLITGWPASLLESGGHADGGRPGETRFGGWVVLLPVLPVVPQVADVVSDDVGGAYTVGSAEQCALGWRLLVRQVGA